MQLVQSTHTARYIFDGEHIEYVSMENGFDRTEDETLFQVRFYVRMSNYIQKEVVTVYSVQNLLESFGAMWAVLSIGGYYGACLFDKRANKAT
jgi:hypothetical protein